MLKLHLGGGAACHQPPKFELPITQEGMVYKIWDSDLTNIFVLMDVVNFFQMFYYLAIVEDFILRYVWIITFLLTEKDYVSSEVMSSITAPLEIFR